MKHCSQVPTTSRFLPSLGGDFGIGIDQLEKIAPALTGVA